MILNRTLLTKSSSFAKLIKFNYLSKRQLDQQLSEIDNSTKLGQVKWQMAYGKFVTKQALSEAKDDLKWYSGMSIKLAEENQEDLQRYYKVKNNIRKLGVPIFLNMLPMGGLLTLGLIKYSPQTLPTWIQIDQDQLQRQEAYNRIRSKVNEKYDVSKINFQTADVKQLKILSLAITGRIVDGTIILNRIFKKDFDFQSFPLNYLSMWLLRRHIKKYLNNHIIFHQTPEATLQQRIINSVNKYQ